jgi:hypothetical protein
VRELITRGHRLVSGQGTIEVIRWKNSIYKEDEKDELPQVQLVHVQFGDNLYSN